MRMQTKSKGAQRTQQRRTYQWRIIIKKLIEEVDDCSLTSEGDNKEQYMFKLIEKGERMIAEIETSKSDDEVSKGVETKEEDKEKDTALSSDIDVNHKLRQILYQNDLLLF